MIEFGMNENYVKLCDIKESKYEAKKEGGSR